MKIGHLCLIFLLFSPFRAEAGQTDGNINPPPPFPLSEDLANIASKHTAHSDLPSQLHIGDLTIELEATTLHQLRAAYPELKEGWLNLAIGDVWVCFAASTPHGKILVWPNSIDMGGPEQTVLGIVIAEASAKPQEHCPQIVQGNAALNLPVWLGMTKSEVISRMGKPSVTGGNELAYSYSLPNVNPKDKTCQPWETNASVVIDFVNGRANRLWINRLTSC